jgi:phosphoribosylformylglycinamidine cyclo-ligase
MLPDGVSAQIDKDSYPVLPIFKLLQRQGNLADQMMYNTYNMGLGMVLAVDPADAEKTLAAIKAAGEEAYAVGKVTAGNKEVILK